MENQYKISDIRDMLMSENELPVKASELNLMLISTGDLVETAIGKVETKQGRKHGICGEYREPEEKNPYWIPLYDDRAAKYVKNLALEVFAERLKPVVAGTENSTQRNTTAPQKAQPVIEPEPSCYKCKHYINGDCGMPRKHICSFYEPCYRPTAVDIEIMERAKEGFGVVGGMKETALGDKDPSEWR